MLNLDDLRAIDMLSHFDDDRLAKIEKITKIKKFKKGEYLYKIGDFAENLYALIDGKIRLEMETATDKGKSVIQCSEGNTFGIASMVDTERKICISSAKCIEGSKLYMWRASDLEKLLYQDYEFGFLFMKMISRIIKRRLQHINAQHVELLSTK